MKIRIFAAFIVFLAIFTEAFATVPIPVANEFRPVLHGFEIKHNFYGKYIVEREKFQATALWTPEKSTPIPLVAEEVKAIVEEYIDQKHRKFESSLHESPRIGEIELIKSIDIGAWSNSSNDLNYIYVYEVTMNAPSHSFYDLYKYVLLDGTLLNLWVTRDGDIVDLRKEEEVGHMSDYLKISNKTE